MTLYYDIMLYSNKPAICEVDFHIAIFTIASYRLSMVNSKSLVSKDFLQIKQKYKLNYTL